MSISREDTLIFKGIAILLVLICHIVGVFGIRYATPLGGIGVSVFLLLSGYGLNESYKIKGLKYFIKKRFSSVYLPYILVVMIDNLILHFNINGLISDLLLITTPNFMWFIQFIVINYFLFYLINLIVPDKYKKFAWIIIGVLSFFFGSSLVAEQSFMFFIGMYLSDNYVIDKLNKNKQIVVSIFLIIIGCIALVMKQTPVIREGNDYVYYLVDMILKNCSAIGVILFFKNTLKSLAYFNCLLQYIGKYSFEIYLVHSIFFFILKDNPNLLGTFIFLIITCAGAILLKFIQSLIFSRQKGEKLVWVN